MSISIAPKWDLQISSQHPSVEKVMLVLFIIFTVEEQFYQPHKCTQFLSSYRQMVEACYFPKTLHLLEHFAYSDHSCQLQW